MYQIKVRTNDTMEWLPPTFPKCSRSIEKSRDDALLMKHIYDHVAIFDLEDNLIEELGDGDSE